jgi:aspartyl-tRNA(Asn)/glutamyl-tRNA(Gln) amidotransferase subunit A
MTSDDLCFLPLHHAADLMARGELSPVALTEAYLDRIERYDTTVRAYLHVRAEQALADARQAEADLRSGHRLGPLQGIPFGLKDNIDVAGVPTTAASRVLAGRIPAAHAPVATALLGQGGVLLGKHNTWEFGTGTGEVQEDLPHPVARNLWDTTRFTGGSSSGTGAAVAAGMAAFGIGSDTGGSVRVPSSANGLVGLKPTLGLLSQRGILPNAPAFDCPGPLTRCVTDSALVMQALTRPGATGATDPTVRPRASEDYTAGLGRGVRGLRVGFIQSFHTRDVEVPPEIVSNLEEAARLFRHMGAEVEAIDLPYSLHDYRACVRVIGQAESLALHGGTFAHHYGAMGKGLRDKFLSSLLISGDDVVHAMRWRTQLCAAVTRLFGRYDVLLCASALQPVPALNDQPGMLQFVMGAANVVFSTTGHPALVMPSGVDGNGLPMSIQLVAPHFQEARLLQVAAAYERERALDLGRPTLQAGATAPARELDDTLPTEGLVSSDSVREAFARLGLSEVPEALLWRARQLCTLTRAQIARMPRHLPDDVYTAHVFDTTVHGRVLP